MQPQEAPAMPPNLLAPAPVTPDPITAILVAVTEMRAMLGGVLKDVEAHGAELVYLRGRAETNASSITRLETLISTLPTKAVSPAAVWTAIGVAVAAIAALATLLGLHLGS